MRLAFYRKYRPKTFGELMGQESTATILQNAARSGRMAHAYLFYGPRGTGKTTTARLVAKLLNCERRTTDQEFNKIGEPCGECTTCISIDAGQSLDLIEIDAASNRGIDEIRNLKENIGTVPLASPHKVYIIDEAHMLTGAAFNALLKTLEEPPPHAILILATTEYEKLPATITSRVQRFLFKKLPKAQIFAKLQNIKNRENIVIDDAALELVAAAAEGSLRDAESLLDQISSSGVAIDLKTAEQLTGRVGFTKVVHLAELIGKKDLAASLEYIENLGSDGHNLVQFTRDLIHYLRKVLILCINPEKDTPLRSELTMEEIKHAETIANLFIAPELTTLLQKLLKAYSEMRYSPFAAIPLEIALTEYLPKSQ